MDERRLDDVYGVTRDVPLNYVVREGADGRLVEALTRDQHIVVYGSSKQGKTCLRKHNLRDVDYEIVTCSNRWSLAQLHSAVLKAVGYTIEGTTTRAVSGDYKIAAKIQGGVGVGPVRFGGQAGAETAETTSTSVEETALELDPADVNDIIAALDGVGAPRLLVLEDFHYLPEETQKDFAVALKAFHESSQYNFVVIGVWLDENRLIQHNGDLTGRVIAIDADQWSDTDLRRVIERGAQLLNVTFDRQFVDDLVGGCFGSVWVVQECCRRACADAGVLSTVDGRVVVGAGKSAAQLIKAVVDQNSARYNAFIGNFVLGFATTTLEMYRWLLWPVLTADVVDLERGLSYSTLRRSIDEHHPDAPINPGNLTQALQSTASLQVGKMVIKPIILDYDQTHRRLNVVDRSFLIWLQHEDREELLQLAGLPTE